MHIKNILYIFIILSAILFSCAQQGNLSGGKKDTTPPLMDSLNSTQNLQTNFTKQDLEFSFNEWLRLEDPFNQVVISPPLRKKHEILLKGKSILFKFHPEEELREDATYTINFGDAVQDLTERNPVEDFRFVFSTGDIIDSLVVQGQVIDAFTKEPVENVIIMLYDNLSDTVVRTEKPFYFGKTDASGIYKIQNVRADTFKTFALVDENVNYLFDLENEKIGFVDTFLVVTDSTRNVANFSIFQEEIPIQLNDEETKKYGFVNFIFNRNLFPNEVEISTENIDITTYLQTDKDTMKLWYDLPADRSWNAFVKKDTILNDTIKIKEISKADFLEKAKLVPAKKIRQGTLEPVPPNQPYAMTFNHPISNIDTSMIDLLSDTLFQKVYPEIIIDSTNKRTVLVKFPYQEKIPYQLTFYPNALTDFFGLKNDTLKINLKAADKNDFSDLTLTVKDIQKDKSYVLEIIDNSKTVTNTITISGDTLFTKKILAMPTGKYNLRMIQDLNNNGRWDPGNYDAKTQSEPLFEKPIEELRAGWEVDAVISTKERSSILQQTPPSNNENEVKEKINNNTPTKGKQ